MRVDFGLILGIGLEYILFIYFANTSIYPRKNYYVSSGVALVGYLLSLCVNMFNYPILSIISFLVINFLLLFYCYETGFKRALFYSIILDTLSIGCEYVFICILQINYNINIVEITPKQSLILTIGSKLIYFISIVLLKIFVKKSNTEANHSMSVLIIVPISTIICLTILLNSNIPYISFCVESCLLLAINIVVVSVNEMVNLRYAEIQKLKDEKQQNQAELTEYRFLAEKYSNTEILHHDFRKHLRVLEGLIKNDSPEAKEYLSQIENARRNSLYTQYTDNSILNTLLNQKISECNEIGVKICVHSDYNKFNFISDFDTVAIFSNLIDNAIEAAKMSKEKNIFIDFYIVNNSFITVKIENSADTPPQNKDGMLQTTKADETVHGIGIKSIISSLGKYSGKAYWSYDSNKKMFRFLLIFPMTYGD